MPNDLIICTGGKKENSQFNLHFSNAVGEFHRQAGLDASKSKFGKTRDCLWSALKQVDTEQAYLSLRDLYSSWVFVPGLDSAGGDIKRATEVLQAPDNVRSCLLHAHTELPA